MNSRNKAISYTVAEGNKRQNHKRRKNISNITPIDLRNLSNHHAANLFPVSEPIPLGKDNLIRTKTKVQPVAQGGIEAKIGAKNTATTKQSPVVMAVSPVRPPSAMPALLSMNAVTGDDPRREPIEIKAASVQYATVDRGKSPVSGSTTPQKRTIEYSVAVASMMST